MFIGLYVLSFMSGIVQTARLGPSVKRSPSSMPVLQPRLPFFSGRHIAIAKKTKSSCQLPFKFLNMAAGKMFVCGSSPYYDCLNIVHLPVEHCT